MKFEFTVNVYVHEDQSVSGRLDRLEASIREMIKTMPTKQEVIDAISQGTADIKQHISDAGARVTKTINDLTAIIEDLKTKVGDPLSQEDLNALVAAQKEAITAADSVDPTTPAPTPITTP